MLMDCRVCLVRINLHGCDNNVAPSIKVAYEFNLKDPLSKSSQVHIRHVFHCDGLLLCTTEDKRLVVWNPCSGDTKWIQPRNSYERYDVYPLGYDNNSSCKKYKILRVVCGAPDRDVYEIYDFTSDSWRVIGSPYWYLPASYHGVSVKGNSYWIALNFAEEDDDLLLCFDFSSERFQILSLPRSFSSFSATLSVVREEQLFLLGTDSRALQVWVTTSPGSARSWSKFLTFKANPEVDANKFHSGLSFLADEQNKAVMCCNSNHNKILHIVGGNKHIQVDPRDGNSRIRPSSRTLVLNYVPSLALIAKCREACDL